MTREARGLGHGQLIVDRSPAEVATALTPPNRVAGILARIDSKVAAEEAAASIVEVGAVESVVAGADQTEPHVVVHETPDGRKIRAMRSPYECVSADGVAHLLNWADGVLGSAQSGPQAPGQA